MKKKIKDFSIEESMRICRENVCSDCPFKIMNICMANTRNRIIYKQLLDEEIEVEENE